jgi:hypothetical protein
MKTNSKRIGLPLLNVGRNNRNASPTQQTSPRRNSSPGKHSHHSIYNNEPIHPSSRPKSFYNASPTNAITRTPITSPPKLSPGANPIRTTSFHSAAIAATAVARVSPSKKLPSIEEEQVDYKLYENMFKNKRRISLSFGVYDTQGFRQTMEDEYFFIKNMEIFSTKPSGFKLHCSFGVCVFIIVTKVFFTNISVGFWLVYCSYY